MDSKQLNRTINTRIIIIYFFSLIGIQALGILYIIKYRSLVSGILVGVLIGVIVPILLGLIITKLLTTKYKEKLSKLP